MFNRGAPQGGSGKSGAFQSAFGGSSTAATATPPAAPSAFKSAFGSRAPSAAVTPPSAINPFQSAFGGAISPSLPAPPAAASPFKSASVSNAADANTKPSESAAPLKSPFAGAAFGFEQSTSGSGPAASKATPAASAAASPNAFKPSRESSSSATVARSATAHATHPKPASSTPQETLSSDVWRCAVCKKVKDLKGPHLNGKTSVRSDCWPCAKKTTFLKDGADIETPPTVPATTVTAASKDSDVWRCEVCKKVKDLKGPHLNGKTSVRSDCWPCAKKTTFMREQANSAPQPPKDAVEMKSGKRDPYQSVFTKSRDAVTTSAASADTPPPASAEPPTVTAASKDSDVWRCAVCKKVKDLKGPHLKGKTSVRSDCWPCAKKTTFLKDNGDSKPPLTAPASATMRPAEGVSKTTVAQSPLNTATPLPPSVTPANEAQAAAFQNIFAAATAAAAAAAKNSVAAGATTSPPNYPFPSSSREGSKNNAAAHSSSSHTLTNATDSSPASLSFSTSRPTTNPFLTPAVSAASIKKFQISYASVMSAKHEDPAAATTTIKAATSTTSGTTASAALRSGGEDGGTTTPATTSDTSRGSTFTPSSSSPYVMESAAGTSPPFTFRPNANYNPAGAAWPTTTLLPGSTAAVNAGSALSGATGTRDGISPSRSPADAKLSLTGGAEMRCGGAALATTSTATATSAPAAVAASSLTSVPAATPVDSPTTAAEDVASVWMCQHCHKVKDLKGDHLRGKTTVRSDCWPCAKKQTFVLTTPSAVAAVGRSLKLGGNGLGGSRSSSLVQRAGTSSTTISAAAAAAAAGESFRASSRPASTNVASAVGLTTHPAHVKKTSVNTSSSATPSTGTSVFAPPPALETPPRAGAPAAAAAAAVPPPRRFEWVLPAVPLEQYTEAPFFLLSPHATSSAALPTPLAVSAVSAAMPSAVESIATRDGAVVTSGVGTAAAVATAPSPSWIATAAVSASDSESDVATYYAAMARFDQQLLKSFRERLVGGVQLRAVWHDRVLYVIAEDTPAEGAGSANAGSNNNGGNGGISHANPSEHGDLVSAFAELGRYAALYLAVEQKLAASRFRHIGRLFCPNEFAFAAACCYANNFFANDSPATPPSSSQSTAAPLTQQHSDSFFNPHSSSPHNQSGNSKFKVYGPQTDPTKSLSLWGRIVAESPVARRFLVSEEQRVVAAQTLYRRVSWLAAPHTMTATAIQLSVEDTAAADVHGVDVVLLTGTMKLEELPQAVSLAQLSQPYP